MNQLEPKCLLVARLSLLSGLLVASPHLSNEASAQGPLDSPDAVPSNNAGRSSVPHIERPAFSTIKQATLPASLQVLGKKPAVRLPRVMTSAVAHDSASLYSILSMNSQVTSVASKASTQTNQSQPLRILPNFSCDLRLVSA